MAEKLKESSKGKIVVIGIDGSDNSMFAIECKLRYLLIDTCKQSFEIVVTIVEISSTHNKIPTFMCYKKCSSYTRIIFTYFLWISFLPKEIYYSWY